MKIKYPYDILIVGVIGSWFLGFLISCFRVLVTRNVDNLLWFLMVAAILVLLRKYELDKFEDQASLTWVEPSFLMLNWLTIGMGLTGFLITFSQYWLDKEVRYFSLIFGLPSLFAILLWRRRKSKDASETSVAK